MKADSKIRFQKSGFQQKLNQARGYTRQIKKIPGSRWETLLAKIGLGSLAARLILLALILFITAATFVPNPLFVRQIKITGLPAEEADRLSGDAMAFLNRNRHLAQNNLLLLSKKKLEAFLLQNGNILNIDSISKNFPNTLSVAVRPRLKSFVLLAGGESYYVSNDGLILGSAPVSASSTNESLTTIEITGQTAEHPKNFVRLFSPELLGQFLAIKKTFPQVIPGGQVIKFKMNGPESEDFIAVTSYGWSAYFDKNSEFSIIWPELAELLDNIDANGQNKLFYIDMRLPKRAYVCYKESACSRITAPTVMTTASSTLSNATSTDF